MKITIAQIKAIMPHAEANIKANKHFAGQSIASVVDLLNKYAEEFDINTPLRLGNTPQADGDGQKYKGRGVIQLTGKANYIAYKNYRKLDVLAHPEILAKPDEAICSSMWFWSRKNLNYYADINAFTTITKLINGGTNGWSERQKYFKVAKIVLGIIS